MRLAPDRNMRSIASLFGLVALLGACESDAERSDRTSQLAMGGMIPSPVERAPANDLEDQQEGGVHRRVATAHGPLHVWTPRHYSETADIVVYVHGTDVHVDDAWKEHRLATQFAASGLDAMFIACEAPAGPEDTVSWASLSELLGTAQKSLGLTLPGGRVIVVGHGAASTVVPWLSESQLDNVVMIDAGSGDIERYKSWLDGRRARQLILVGNSSAQVPGATVLERVPALGQVRVGGRAVYVKSQLGHRELVTSGTVLPVVLQMAGDEAGVPIAQIP